MTIGQNIRACRKLRGLTQNQLGALCGISGASVGSYEKGATLPKRRVVEKIASALSVPPERLTGGPDAPQREPEKGVLLYDGVLSALRELYGAVEGRVILGENGDNRKYYIVQDARNSFVLRDQDIAAIAQSAQASTALLAARLRGA